MTKVEELVVSLQLSESGSVYDQQHLIVGERVFVQETGSVRDEIMVVWWIKH
jgi:hypothetical protein